MMMSRTFRHSLENEEDLRNNPPRSIFLLPGNKTIKAALVPNWHERRLFVLCYGTEKRLGTSTESELKIPVGKAYRRGKGESV